MADPNIKIKRSAVAGKRPTAEQLLLGELALNTHDGELFTLRDRFSSAGIATEVVPIGMGASVTNIIYVTADGNDNNTGNKLGDAKATIAGAVAISTTGSVIKVSAGTYIENNPIKLYPQVSIVGESLREVTIQPQNSNQDLFHVAPGNYISEVSFNGTLDVGKAVIAFDPDTIRTSTQSPYIKSCTNFISGSIGMKVDGNAVDGDFNSMVTDAYTQYNQNGIGCSITNNGYAQIVSMFNICNDIGVYCGSGGQCDITNSNSSFGNYGLIADGVGASEFTGIITSAADAGSFVFTVSGASARPYDGQVVYFNELYYEVNKITVGSGGTGYLSPPIVTITSPSTDWGIDATAVSEINANGEVTGLTLVSNGRGFTTTPTVTISSPDVGINTATATVELIQKYYLIQSATPVSDNVGLTTITINETLPYAVGVGTTVPFFKQSRILASGHSFEYIGSGVTIATALPQTGGVTIQENETDSRNGGLVVYTSTDQSGNFRIGDGVVINQSEGSISGNSYSKSLFANVTPLILALGG